MDMLRTLAVIYRPQHPPTCPDPSSDSHLPPHFQLRPVMEWASSGAWHFPLIQEQWLCRKPLAVRLEREEVRRSRIRVAEVRWGFFCGCRGHMEAHVARLSPPTFQAQPGEQGLYLHYPRMGICWQASPLWAEMVGGSATNAVGSTYRKREHLLILECTKHSLQDSMHFAAVPYFSSVAFISFSSWESENGMVSKRGSRGGSQLW